MIEQNTSRMWYVIGAVLLGASILFGLNQFAPNVMASVESMAYDYIAKIPITFEERSINPYIRYHNIPEQDHIDEFTYYLYSDGLRENRYGGLEIHSDALEEGKRHRLSFDFQKLSGEVATIGGHLRMTKEDRVRVFMDGELLSRSWDVGEMNPYPDDNEVHRFTIDFVVQDEFPEGNNNNLYIQPNRSGHAIHNPDGYYYPAYEAMLYNFKLEVVE